MPVNPHSTRRSNSIISNTTRTSPKWQSSSTSKRSPATSVSLVFAHPEQCVPLGSAIEKLPIVMADDTVSLSSAGAGVRPREQEILENVSVVGAGGNLVPDVEISTVPVTAEESVSNSHSVSQSSVNNGPISEVPTVPELTSVKPEFSNPPFPLPPSRSWFGSFTRSREHNTIPTPHNPTPSRVEAPSTAPQSEGIEQVPAPSVTEDSPPQSSDVSRTQAIPNSPQNAIIDERPSSPSTAASSPSQPIPILHELTASRSWFSSSLSSPPRKSSTPHEFRPLNSHSTSNLISTSTVDDEVPRPKSTPTEVQSSNASASPASISQEEKVRVSCLTSSPSRFTLRMPLLGRPKMPLDQVVAIAQAEDIGKVPSHNDFQNQNAQISVTAEQAKQVQIVTAPTMDDTSEAVQSEKSEVPGETKMDGGNKAYSWWDYVGWSSSTSIQTAPSASSSHDTMHLALDSPQTSEVDTPTQSESLFPTAQLPLSTHASVLNLPESNGNSREVQDQTESNPAPSIRSVESNKSLSNAWYSPWSWYSAYGTAGVSTDEIPDSMHVESFQSPAEPELVNQDMLVNVTSQPTLDKSDHPGTQTLLSEDFDLANPIQSTLTDNKSGWASFFLSRSVKSITEAGEKREDGGMEVMDIDEDEEPQILSASASTKSGKAPEPGLQQQSPPPSKPSSTKLPKPLNKEKEHDQNEPATPPPLINDESVKRKGSLVLPTFPSPHVGRQNAAIPVTPRQTPPNLVLPTWGDTFRAPPRSVLPPSNYPCSIVTKTFRFVGELISLREGSSTSSAKGKERAKDFLHFGKELPRALDVVGEKIDPVLLNGECKVAVIGVAGWVPGAVTRTIAGGLPSSSGKFVTMTCEALQRFEESHGVKFKKITKIALEGDGTVARKVEKVHKHLLDNPSWMDDLHAADVIFVAAHSQGTIVAIHLIDLLIQEGHIRTSSVAESSTEAAMTILPKGTASPLPTRRQKICCLSLCGIHLGPLRYFKMSSLLQPYLQYIENAAARELFEFQNTDHAVSRDYVNALKNVMHQGTKMVYVASLNDQMVPIYSGLFTAACHPHILRALYIDGDAYHSSDFLSNLLVLLLRILNSGLSDSGLLTHLSEATAGSLNGVGHSSAYEEPGVFSLAVNYQFLVNDGDGERHELVVEPFNAVTEQNDYEIPWSLRDLIANERVAHLFAREFVSLRDAFGDWQPKTTPLRDVKRKLQPIQRLPSISRIPSGLTL